MISKEFQPIFKNITKKSHNLSLLLKLVSQAKKNNT